MWINWTDLDSRVQYKPRALQHLHARKLRAIWRISTKFHAINSRVNFYASFYTQTFYTQIWEYFYGDWFRLQKYTENVTDVKLETDIVEKRLFVVKEKTTYCTLSLTTIANIMFCNQWFPWLLLAFTCKLGCKLLATTVVLK